MKVRTSVLKGFALLALSTFAFTACDEKEPTTVVPDPVAVSVTPASVTIQVGQTTNFVANVANATNRNVTWATSTPAVATVNATTGVVTAVAPGSAVITATSVEDNTKAASGQVIVVAAPTPDPVEVSVVPSSASMQVDQTLQLVPVVRNATNTAVTYQSLDQNIATVSATGLVTAEAPGTAVIRVSSVQDPTRFATSVITVTPGPTPTPIVVTITPSQASGTVGQLVGFSASVSGTTNQAVNWTSTVPTVATVDANGVATLLAAGSTVIRATSAADPTKSASATLVVSAGPPIQVTITPANATLQINGQQQFVATVTNATNEDVTWSSSNEAVLEIDENGLATAIAAGTATVRATSVQNPTRSAQASVTVSAAPPVTQPSISIASVVNQATLLPVPANTPTGGALTVRVNISAGSETDIDDVQIRLNGQVICTQTFNPPLAPTQGVAQIDCPINTLAVNADGTPMWPNGTYELTAVARADGGVVATANYGNLIIANANVVTTTIRTNGNNAIGGATSVAPGLRWDEGDVLVDVTPTMYAGGSVASVRVCLNVNGTAIPTANSVAVPVGTVCRTATTSANNMFTVTFPKASAHSIAAAGVAGVEAQNLTASVTTITAAGSNGPIGTSNAINLDNQAPVVTSLIINPNQYVNGSFAFGGAAGCAAAPFTGTCFAMNDLGSDSQVVDFNVLNTAGAVVTGGADITNPSGLEETTTSTQRVLQAVVTDAVGNTRTVYGSAAGAPATTVATATRFGVDLTDPTITVASGPPNNSSNPATNLYNFTFVDAGIGPSGFSATPLQIRVRQFTPDGNGGVTVACINPATGAQLAGAGNGCTPSSGFVTVADAATDVTLPFAGVDAYFEVTGRVRDFAGNTSDETVRVTMDDQDAPAIGNIITPTSISGGTAVTFSAQMQDNVELGDQLGYVGYAGLGLFLVTDRDVLASYGFDELTTPRNATHTIDQFIRSVQTAPAGDPTAGAIVTATDMNLAVRDMAGMQTSTVCPPAGVVGEVEPGAPFTLTGSCTTVQANIINAVNLGMNNQAETSWAAANRPFGPVSGTNPNGGGTSFNNTTTVAPVCSNIPAGAAGCPTNPSTKTVRATATGPAQTFANPFNRVEFYYTDASGRSHRIGTGTVTVTDNTVTNIRTWTYTATWNPGAMGVVAAAGYPVFALGIDGQGRALMSDAVMVPVTSD